MAKDGTARGGGRVGAGRKRKPIAEKILEGQSQASIKVGDLDVSELEGEEMPPVKDYLKENQKNGIDLEAERIFKATWAFLDRMGCSGKINVQIIELYSMTTARWVQCERAISKFGLLAKHPTTGGATISPYVHISHEYSKQANAAWYQLAQIVRENSAVSFDQSKEQDSIMESLLSRT